MGIVEPPPRRWRRLEKDASQLAFGSRFAAAVRAALAPSGSLSRLLPTSLLGPWGYPASLLSVGFYCWIPSERALRADVVNAE